MRANPVRAGLRAGEPQVGTWLQLNSPPATRLLAAQGLLQWMLVDFEHSPPDPMLAATLLGSIVDVSAGRVAPLARAADTSTTAIELALDCGAQGVIVPMVEDAETAARAVSSARYAPDGIRGAGGLAPHLGFAVSRPHYLRNVNDRILVGVQIETPRGIANLDEIVTVPGIDLVFLGPNDLHLALDKPPRFWSADPDFLAAVDRLHEATTRAGLPLGTLCRDAVTARQRIAEGFRFVGLGSDAHFMLTFAGQEIGAARDIASPSDGIWCDVVNVPVLDEKGVAS